MLPKKSKHFIQPTAEELNIDVTLVDDAISFFYLELRKSLVNLKSNVIHVDKLCTFKAKSSELPKLMIKYTKHLAVLKPETFNQMAAKKDLEGKLEKVYALDKLIKAEMIRKKEFLEKKYGAYKRPLEK
tara:strand:- start:765 stop:1151 length:387 start_codon:yes stop_codon:yes gene_type:complete